MRFTSPSSLFHCGRQRLSVFVVTGAGPSPEKGVTRRIGYSVNAFTNNRGAKSALDSAWVNCFLINYVILFSSRFQASDWLGNLDGRPSDQD
jgi:hypothetical protein